VRRVASKIALTLVLLACGCHAQNQGVGTSTTSPSPTPNKLCSDIAGAWDAKSGRCTLDKDLANGVHVEVKATYPADLVDNPVAGPVLGPFVRKFLSDYGQAGANGTGDADLAYSLFTHSQAVKTVFFQADWYFAQMAHPNGEITTFTFDFDKGKQLQLADLFCQGTDPLKAIPAIARPFVQQALVGSPFRVEEFEPDKPEGELADNYQAWVLDADDLVLYMPAARGPGGVPPAFISPRIPMAEFGAISREKGCASRADSAARAIAASQGTSYCQDLWMSEFQAASSVVGGSSSFPGSSSPNCWWMSNRPPCNSSNGGRSSRVPRSASARHLAVHLRSVMFRLVAQQDRAAREGAVLQQSQRDP
jgi:hypothetical protein